LLKFFTLYFIFVSLKIKKDVHDDRNPSTSLENK
jgi:hypothetical protein